RRRDGRAGPSVRRPPCRPGKGGSPPSARAGPATSIPNGKGRSRGGGRSSASPPRPAPRCAHRCDETGSQPTFQSRPGTSRAAMMGSGKNESEGGLVTRDEIVTSLHFLLPHDPPAGKADV